MSKINFKDSNYYKNLEKYPMVKEVVETFINDNYYEIEVEVNEDTKKEYVLFLKERYYDNDFENLESFYSEIEKAVMNNKNIANSNKQELKKIIYNEIYNTLIDYDLKYDSFEESLQKTAIDYVDWLDDEDREKEFKTQLIGFLSEEGWDKEKLIEEDLDGLIENLNENQEICTTYNNETECILSTTFQATICARTFNEANSDLSHIGNLFSVENFIDLFNIETSQEKRDEIFENLKENYQDELDNGFIKFLHSQGLSLEVLNNSEEFDKYNNKYPNFIKSLITEIENTYKNGCNIMTYLVEIPFEEAIIINTAHNLVDKLGGILNKEDEEKSWLNNLNLKISKNTMCGIFDPISGSGSILEIYVPQEFEIDAKNAVVLINGNSRKECNFGWYEADEVYGLSQSAYQHGENEVTTTEKSPQLNLSLSIEEELIKKQENKQQLKI